MTLPSNLNRFGKGMRRPYYCEVEYLESSGAQYIDTGIKYAGTSDVITLGIAPMQSTGDIVFIGAYTLSPNSFVELGAYNGKYRGNIQTPADIPASMTYTVGVRNTLKFTSNGWWEFNGQQCGVTRTDPVDIPFYLFCRNYSSSPKYSSARIYNLDIVRSGVKILDMIPVLDWDMVPCMYDKISNKLFYNKGTGDFTYGRQIHYVNYLESTGTQYIDTGIIPTIKTKTSEKTRILSGGGKTPDFVRWSGNPTYDTFGTYLAGANIAVYYGKYSDNKVKSFAYTVGTDFEIVNDINEIVFNGSTSAVDRGSNDWTNTTYTLCLFAGNNMGNVSFFTDMRLYYYKVWDNDVLLRDYKPAVDENGKGFMFDKVEHKIYDNVGTGNFSYPDIELEYLESTGTQYIDTLENDTAGYFYETVIEPLSDGAWVLWFGRQETSAGGNCDFVGYNGDIKLGASVIQAGVGNTIGKLDAPVNTLYKIESSSVVSDVYFSSNGVKTTASRTGSVSSKNVYLFCINNAGTANNFTNMRLNYFKMRDKDGILVRDFIPILRNGVAGLIDIVNSVFYTNQGSGTFSFKIKENK